MSLTGCVHAEMLLDVDISTHIDIPEDSYLDLKFDAELHSTNPAFGGISGLCVDRKRGEILALSDRGYFIQMNVTFDLTGNITGLTLAEITPVYQNTGSAVDPRLVDTEALACVGSTVYVAHEQVTRILAYERDDLRAMPVAVPLPNPVLSLSGNKSIEAIAIPPDYTKTPGLVVIPEWSGEGNPHRLWWIPLDGHQRRFTQLATDSGYMATDAAFDTQGRLYVLERKFALPTGFSMRLRRFNWPDSSLDLSNIDLIPGETLLEMNSEHGVDNMEGLSIWNEGDEIKIIAISDDNYVFFQKTLLLNFQE